MTDIVPFRNSRAESQSLWSLDVCRKTYGLTPDQAAEALGISLGKYDAMVRNEVPSPTRVWAGGQFDIYAARHGIKNLICDMFSIEEARKFTGLSEEEIAARIDCTVEDWRGFASYDRAMPKELKDRLEAMIRACIDRGPIWMIENGPEGPGS